MTQQDAGSRFPSVGDGSGMTSDPRFYREELQLTFRNRGMPLEGLRYDATPTGMHYLLIHFDIPEVDLATWNLKVGGLVDRPAALSLDDIKALPARTEVVTMECAGNGRALFSPRSVSQPWLLEAVGTSEWTGTPLKGVLDAAGVGREAVEILFTGSDQGVQGEEVQYYQRSLTIEEANRDEVMLVYEMNGRPLEPQHGYPLRLIVPGWYGMTSVKWLESIEAISEPFNGYQMHSTYRYAQSADDPGEPVDLIRVRALMVPPGIPDFLTRTRLLSPGPVTLTGRAWAGRSGISRVEISADGGENWSDAQLGVQPSRFAWRGWTAQWNAQLNAAGGRYTLMVRATDTEGNRQSVEPEWNIQGMGNNMAHSVDVIVE
ncbi:MAG: sulfite oxidase [Chloroflexi bacterium]|nr:sulfite oxidase [Chloroflexota bacterium]